MATPRSSRRWRFAAGLLIVVIVLGAVAYNRGRAPRPDPTIDDPSFVLAADRLCAESLPRLRATRETVKSEESREAETVTAIYAASAGIDALVLRLRALDMRPGSKAEISAWLDHWGDYTEAGRRYAEAIRRGNPLRYGRVDDESVGPLRAISTFSRGNRIDACIP